MISHCDHFLGVGLVSLSAPDLRSLGWLKLECKSGRSGGMSDDQFPLAHSGLVTDLRVLRRTGRWRLRNRDVPAFERAARLGSADLQDRVIAVDDLVCRAIDNLDDGQLGQAAKLLLGIRQENEGLRLANCAVTQPRFTVLLLSPFDTGPKKALLMKSPLRY
jgi:hypothetical protein